MLKLGKRGKQEPQLSQRQGWIVDDGLRSITMGGHTWDFIPCSKWKSRTWEAGGIILLFIGKLSLRATSVFNIICI